MEEFLRETDHTEALTKLERKAAVYAQHRLVEYPSGAFLSHAVNGRRDEYYSTSDDFSPIPLTSQFVPGMLTDVAQVVKEGGHRALRQLITDAPFVKDASSVQSLRKTDFLFGDSVRDPDAVFIDAEQWLHKNSGGFIYLPKIPRHRSLTELRRQAAKREMSWRLTEEHESVHYLEKFLTVGSKFDSPLIKKIYLELE
ncbi:uncharacterized protein A4U43_C04F24670 [Asparagus officinalis]|uniref:Uncharacterized protein n=1 Tax=Asparagus officinalis TaxID=4686 RepID=A0A5P1F3F9_ASPOF|nr:uncharacterized protein A4U43_C04F24670 [Asparagus officinalis]